MCDECHVSARVGVVETESEPSSPPEVNNNNMDSHFKIVTLVLAGCIVISGTLMFVLIFSLYLKWRSGRERENFMKKCPSLMEEGKSSLASRKHIQR